MAMSILATKLGIPPMRTDLVPRPRVTGRLRDERARQLILICAPAGFGKTTLAIEWLHQKDASPPSQVAWLTLDQEDNDPVRFVAYLLAALQNANPAIGTTVQAMMQSPQPPPSQVLLTALINDIAAVPKDLFLVLDDYHFIHTLAIHQQLAFLLDHQPSQMHLVVVSREDPPLPLARLRARGQILEIRQNDLQFTEDETADLMRRGMKIELSREDVAALHQRTEGWIAGLQLACLFLRNHLDAHQFIESFTGSNRFVLDYLLEEVFGQQPAEVREFLLKTSILQRMCAELCDSLFSTNRDSQRVLERLEHINLFVVPLDNERRWYRYHRLFADLLHHRLRLDSASDVAQLHQRASAWYAANGFPVDAIHHALAASDWERASTLVLGECESLLRRGEIVTILRWLQVLPEDILRGNPELCLYYSWALLLTGQLDAAESHLKQAETIAPPTTSLLGSIYAAQAQIARTRGDDQRTIELSTNALTLMPVDAFSERSVVTLNLGIAYLNQRQLADAEQVLIETERAGRISGNHYAQLIALTFLGIIQVVLGKLHHGKEFFEQAIQSGGDSPAVALAHLHYGALLYEWNDLALAAAHLQRGLEMSQRGGNPEVQIGAYRTLALLKQVQGDAPAARATLDEAHQFARAHKLPAIMSAAIAANYVQIAIAQNDLATAIHWIEQITQPADASPFYPNLGLTRARLLIAQKQYFAASAELANCFESVSDACWEGGLITIRVLQSLAADTKLARLEFLIDALKRAQSEGYIRTFADAGEGLLPLLEDVALQGMQPEYVGKIIAAIKHKPITPAPSLIEPLSERELEVLRLVAAGLSNLQIAKKLILSEGTVKTHVHNIYGKLDAQNRAQAIARAREVGII
ncbi:MAG: AAA family ATPase [Chloroflexi bacterium]|nr:AAA family ATPase [Chloroflexota bacterium]